MHNTTSDMFTCIEHTTSTNEIAKHYLNSPSGFCITTKYQTQGRGQAGNSWVSEYNKNLLASYVLDTNIELDKSFAISMIASLAVLNLLNSHGLVAQIKWPNDIIIEDKKIAGILIENIISGEVAEKSIIGIGLNLNQREFPEVPQATSLSLLSHNDFDPKQIAKEMQQNLLLELNQYRTCLDKLKHNYYHRLYRRDIAAYNDGKTIFVAKIVDVAFDGRLTLHKENGNLASYYFKQIKMIF